MNKTQVIVKRSYVAKHFTGGEPDIGDPFDMSEEQQIEALAMMVAQIEIEDVLNKAGKSLYKTENTGVTNISPSSIPRYARTIAVAQQMGVIKPGEVFISLRSLGDEFGDQMPSIHHANRTHDLSAFWNVDKVVSAKTDTTMIDKSYEIVYED